MEQGEGTLAQSPAHRVVTSSTARRWLLHGVGQGMVVGQVSGWCWVLLKLRERTSGCMVFSDPLPCVGHIQGCGCPRESCTPVVTNSPTHVAGVHPPSRGGKVQSRSRGPRGDRILEGALSPSDSQIHSHLHILGTCLHPTPPASSSLTCAPGGQRLLQRHKRGIIARVCGVPCAIFHSLLQAEQPSGS